MLSAFSSVLPVARLLLFCIHSRSITMPCWGTLSGYSAWIRLISDCCTPSSLASGTQSWPSRLQMSERRRSARWIDSVVRVAAHTQNAKLVSPNNSRSTKLKINLKKKKTMLFCFKIEQLTIKSNVDKQPRKTHLINNDKHDKKYKCLLNHN